MNQSTLINLIKDLSTDEGIDGIEEVVGKMTNDEVAFEIEQLIAFAKEKTTPRFFCVRANMFLWWLFSYCVPRRLRELSLPIHSHTATSPTITEKGLELYRSQKYERAAMFFLKECNLPDADIPPIYSRSQFVKRFGRTSQLLSSLLAEVFPSFIYFLSVVVFLFTVHPSVMIISCSISSKNSFVGVSNPKIQINGCLNMTELCYPEILKVSNKTLPIQSKLHPPYFIVRSLNPVFWQIIWY